MKTVLISLSMLAAGQTALAQPWSFTRIVDSDTKIPGSDETFDFYDAFHSACAFGDRVAFQARSPSSKYGVYEWRNGVGRVVADGSTPMPRGGGTFLSFGEIAMTATSVVFRGGGQYYSGYYKETPSGIARVVDKEDSVPGRDTNFDGWWLHHDAVGDSTVFRGDSDFRTFQGVYRNDDGELSRVLDMSMSPPGRDELFSAMVNWRLDGDATYVTARTASGYEALMRCQGDQITTIIDNTTPGPDGVPLHYPGYARPWRDGVLFRAEDRYGIPNLYTKVGDTIEMLISGLSDTSGGGIADYEFLNGVILFESAPGAIYAHYDGQVHRIISPGDLLDGKVIREITLYEHAFDGTTAAFIVVFDDDSMTNIDRAIYTVTIPAPGAAGLAAALVLSSRSRRRPAPRSVLRY